MDDFFQYADMKRRGHTAEEILTQGLREGLDEIAGIRMIRRVFDFDLGEAKDVWLRAHGVAKSRDDFQGEVADLIRELPRRGTT